MDRLPMFRCSLCNALRHPAFAIIDLSGARDIVFAHGAELLENAIGFQGAFCHWLGGMTEEFEPALGELLSAYPPAIGRMARALVGLIADAFPELETRVVPGWQGVTFHHPKANYIACLMASPKRVSLMFVNGRELEDPEGMLVDHGKHSAFLRFAPGDEISAGTIVYYVHEAIALRS